MAADETDRRANAFARVLKALLRPLVKAMIAQGVTAPAVYRLLKEVYVEVAEADFALDGSRPTDSRISVLTGIHRKDVRTIRAESNGDGAAARRKVSVIATVVGRWLADPATTDETGAPRPLPRLSGDGPSFEALVTGVNTDIRPRTVLDELTRQGLAQHDTDKDLVTLDTDAFLGPADFEQKAHFFAHNVGDHISAATENLLQTPAPFIERAVFYNRLRSSSVDEIEAEARRLGGEALSELNRLGYARQSTDMEAEEATERFRFGIFFYRTDEGDAGEDSASRADGESDGDSEGGEPKNDQGTDGGNGGT